MESADQILMEPSFAKDPPVKINVPAKTLGLAFAILGAIGALFGLAGVFALLGLSAAAAAAGIFAALYPLAVVGALVGLGATILVAWGGWQMYQGRRDGKRLTIYGLVLNVIGNVLGSLGSGDLVGWVLGAAIAFVAYYLVIISRFPDEPALVR